MMNRRTLVTGIFAAAIPMRAEASVGLSASLPLIQAFESVNGIMEGNGGGTLHVLYAPWCHISPMFFSESRAIISSGKLKIKWIPFSGGQPEGRLAVEKLLRNPVASNISNSFIPIRANTLDYPTPLSDQQDQEVSIKLENLIIRDSGNGLMTPTFAYRMGDRVRLLPGGISSETIELIARVAS